MKNIKSVGKIWVPWSQKNLIKLRLSTLEETNTKVMLLFQATNLQKNNMKNSQLLKAKKLEARNSISALPKVRNSRTSGRNTEVISNIVSQPN